jgi:phage portal protein BeeE
MLISWQARYKPDAGGRRPLILDGGIEVDKISNVNFKELDFQNAIAENEKIILKALGVPPILLDSGNNANIRPNLRLYYLETVLPIVRKLNFALERYFGFEISEDVTNIPALQPELRDQSQYYTSLVNTGVITPNEARVKLGFESIEGHDELRIPANIAGSAVDSSEGGRPVEDNEGDN